MGSSSESTFFHSFWFWLLLNWCSAPSKILHSVLNHNFGLKFIKLSKSMYIAVFQNLATVFSFQSVCRSIITEEYYSENRLSKLLSMVKSTAYNWAGCLKKYVTANFKKLIFRRNTIFSGASESYYLVILPKLKL